MKPAIAQVCSLHAPFEGDIADYAAGACHAMEIWLGKLETYLETHTIDDVRRLLDEHQMAAPVASYQGGLLTSQGEARKEHWAHFRRRLELCQQLQIATLVVAADIYGPLDDKAIERASLSLGQAAIEAGNRGVRLALEFEARASFINNLQTAAAVVADCNDPHLGICFDVFQYYLGPSKPDDLGYLSNDNLFHVQLSDLAGQPRELATDADRVLPGDGDFLLEQLLDTIRRLGYDGYVSLELMNPQIWQIPPLQVGEVGMTALRKVLGQAGMGD